MPQQRPKKPTRLFTRTDIEQFFKESWGKMNDPKNELQQIQLLPELSPPTWRVEYTATYRAGTRYEHMSYCEILVLQKISDTGRIYLNTPNEVDLPEGLATPAEEDAEIARREQAKQAEQRKRWEGK